MMHRIWPVQATSFRDSLRDLKAVQKSSRGAPSTHW